MRNLKHKVALLFGALFGTYSLASATYMLADHKSFWDSLWWAFMTFTTVGYGDQYPNSIIGRITGMLLVATAVFLVIPSVTAVIVSKILGDHNEFTHEEQEELKRLIMEIHSRTV